MKQNLLQDLHRVEDRLIYYKSCATEFACSSIKANYYKKKIDETSKAVENLKGKIKGKENDSA